MTTGTQFIGLHATLSINSVPITNMRSISGLAFTMGQVETTVIGATAKTFLPTLVDNGEIQVEVGYDTLDTSHASITTLLYAGTVVPCVLTLKTGSTYTFSGFVISFEPSGFEPEGLVIATFKLKITGTNAIAAA